jgi:hypothetical protein
MVILMALALPAFNAMNGAGDLTKAASDIQSFLQEARSEAMAKNTYVDVGLVELDGLSVNPSNGIGKIVIAAVASPDGTSTNTAYTPISKALILENVHLTNAASLTSGTNMTGRPGGADSSVPASQVCDLSSVSSTNFQWPLPPAAIIYSNFPIMVTFDPQGIPSVQAISGVGYYELPIVAAHGDVVSSNSMNQAAIQIDGVTGAVRVYRP